MNAKEIASECEKEMKKQQVIMDTHLTPTLQVCDKNYFVDPTSQNKLAQKVQPMAIGFVWLMQT